MGRRVLIVPSTACSASCVLLLLGPGRRRPNKPSCAAAGTLPGLVCPQFRVPGEHITRAIHLHDEAEIVYWWFLPWSQDSKATVFILKKGFSDSWHEAQWPLCFVSFQAVTLQLDSASDNAQCCFWEQFRASFETPHTVGYAGHALGCNFVTLAICNLTDEMSSAKFCVVIEIY